MIQFDVRYFFKRVETTHAWPDVLLIILIGKFWTRSFRSVIFLGPTWKAFPEQCAVDCSASRNQNLHEPQKRWATKTRWSPLFGKIPVLTWLQYSSNGRLDHHLQKSQFPQPVQLPKIQGSHWIEGCDSMSPTSPFAVPKKMFLGNSNELSMGEKMLQMRNSLRLRSSPPYT